MSTAKRSTTLPWLGGDEYEIVPVSLSWGMVSIGIFMISLFIRPMVRLFVPWTPQQPFLVPMVIGLSMPIVGVIGLVFGLIGWRRSPSKVTAKVGIFLNGAVVLITLLLFGAFYVWRFVL